MRRDKPSSGGGSPLAAVPKWAWGAAVVVIAAIVAGVLGFSGGGNATSSSVSVRATMVAAGCTYADVKPFPPKDKLNFHADSPTLTSKVKWATFPPSAGGHYGLWAVWGFYTSPVNPRQVVHDEEHGGVILWWGPKVPASTVNQLQAFYNASPVAMFGTPIAGLGDKVAVTAWTGNPATYYRNGDYGIGHIATCPGFNKAAFTTFRNAYRGNGPEGIPTADDQPGMGPG
jgi:hypothetical protein